MKSTDAALLFEKVTHKKADSVQRCGIGTGNYVFLIDTEDDRFVLRCSDKPNAYHDTIQLLEQLRKCDIPVPQVIKSDVQEKTTFLVLSYIPGDDIGNIYEKLSNSEKHQIAREVIAIQNRASQLEVCVPEDWSWSAFPEEMLYRAETRISANGYFDLAKVAKVREIAEELSGYFSSVQPIPYLDDISTKNLLIQNGEVSGIIDVDWIGTGDPLTFIALTNVALMNMDYDTDYVKYLLDELNPTDLQYQAFLFYSLLFCVDFMGERGTTFLDKTVPVNQEIVDRLNYIFEILLSRWHRAQSTSLVN